MYMATAVEIAIRRIILVAAALIVAGFSSFPFMLLLVHDQILRRPMQRLSPANKGEKQLPLILDWTWFFHEPMGEARLAGCPDQCEISWDRRRVLEASAVVFHIRDMLSLDLPPFRMPWQRYVFFIAEPPFLTWMDLTRFDGFFNWTMTHRMDSDAAYPYGVFLPKPQPDPNENENAWRRVFRQKTKLVAWFVSRCSTPSQREVIAKELQKYIPLDIYGKCGNKVCHRSDSESCEELLNNRYKFYLAFENSVCRDYVTEKALYRMQKLIVPIVLSRKVAESVLPNDSFIAVDDFPTIQQLADHLNYLDSHPDSYFELLQWRKRWSIEDCANSANCGFCKLCQKLKGSTGPPKVYGNIDQWWYKDAGCQDKFGEKFIKLQGFQNLSGRL